MNIVFKIAGKVVTPMLNGSILPGITRDSVLTLCRDWGYEVEERKISVDELIEAAHNGTLEEVFGTGTAAVVSPVGKLRYKDEVVRDRRGKIGELTQKLYDELTGIQWGKRPDTRGLETDRLIKLYERLIDMSNQRIETKCVQGGYTPGNGEPRQIPIIQSTTFKYATSEDMGKLFDLEAEATSIQGSRPPPATWSQEDLRA